ncbi:beta strand repeat-containing protein [Fuerstiella marisgermanici]|uniref:Uncharacterized protein n=1 Tax=Fuerstiella marisgermanici TaxID=1891926 RepID=A0A1P8WJ43_9PLAN|nr:hypothetical protein [Fuerstiella marisgermanici]APZ94085.1 hypothetical protein Fuma_03706 [Fuerstiella marisgermanici]
MPSVFRFIDQLRHRLHARPSTRRQPKPQAAHSRSQLKVTRLEQRILLDAGFGINMAGILTLNGFDAGDTLTMQGDLGSSVLPPTGVASFTLTDGVWDATDADLLSPEFSLSPDSKTLIFNSPVSVDGVAIDASTAPLDGVATSGGGLQVDQLQITNGGDVDLSTAGNNFSSVSVLADNLTLVDADDLQLNNLDISGTINVTTNGDITDAAGSEITVGGSAAFTADSVTLGDDAADETNFGSLRVTASSDVQISEDSDILVESVNGDNVVLTSAGRIDDAAADITNDITANTIDLNAADGIGETAELELAATSISADTTAGDIDLDNQSAAATTVTSLTTQDGVIRFDQSGGGDVSFTNVASADASGTANAADITLTSSAGLTAGDITTEGTGSAGTAASDITLSAGSPTVAADSILLTGLVDAGEGTVRLISNGTINQTAAGMITAGILGVRQEGTTGDIRLGGAANDVDVLAAQNLAVGGDVVYFDNSAATIANVAARNADGVSFSSTTGVSANAGDINITTVGDLIVNEDINAAHNSLTTSIDEAITLISRQGNFELADSTIISSDENTAAGVFDDVTGDRITIIAGSVSGTGNVNLGTNVEVRTDGGVARQIAPRPTAFASAPTDGAESAFVTLSNAQNRRSSLTPLGDSLLGVMQLVFGVDGEENLQVVVDWGVVSQTSLTDAGLAGDAVPGNILMDVLEFSLTDADKTIYNIDEGGLEYRIPHLYSPLDLGSTPNDRNGHEVNPGIIGVRFSVSQHASINVWGDSATIPGSTDVNSPPPFTSSNPLQTITDATGQVINQPDAGLSLLSSTDTNPTDQFPQQTTETLFDDDVLTNSGVPVGRSEWEFTAGPPPGTVLNQPQARPTIDARPLDARDPLPIFETIADDVSFGAGASSETAIGTEVYLQIRRQYELDAAAEVVVSRVTDNDFISSRESFEAFVRDNPELTDGSGYEVWLVTETDGQVVQRPIVQFEITGGRPEPATEELPASLEPLELQPVPFEQPDGEDGAAEEPDADGNVDARADAEADEDTDASEQDDMATEGGVIAIPVIATSAAAKWRQQQKRRDDGTELTSVARRIRRMKSGD